MNYDDIPLVNNEAAHNFELRVDDAVSFIDYKQKGDKMYLIHTEVPEELEGHGIAAALVEKTLAYIEAHHLKVIPLCSYVAAYLKRHPQWNHLLFVPE